MTALMVSVTSEIWSYRIYEAFFCLLSFVVNLLVVALISKRSSGELRSFRVILLSSTLTDLFFTFINIFTMNCTALMKGCILFYNLGPLIDLPRPLALFASAMWMFALNLTYTTLCFQFGYRYNSLVCENPWSNRRVLSVYVGMMVYSFVIAICAMLCWAVGPDREYFADYMMEQGYVVEGNRTIWPAAAEVVGYGFITIFMHVVYCAFCYGAVLYFAFHIRRRIKETRDVMSPATRTVQRQINYILGVQTIVPLLLTIIPITTVCIMALTDVTVPGVSEFLARCTAVIPVTNAATVITVVPGYRRTVWAMFCKGKLRSLFTTTVGDSHHSKTSRSDKK